MKTLQTVACSLLLSLALSLVGGLHAEPPNTFSPFPPAAASPTPPPPELQEYINEGKAAYARGDFEAAKTAFDMAYQLDSRNTLVIGYLRRLKIDAQTKPKNVPMERQLAGIVIPQIQFHDATLGSALEYLKASVKRQTNDRQSVNFVVQLPAEEVAKKTVTLNLNNVPFTEALRYFGTVAGLDFQFDKYAILVKPTPGYIPAAGAAPTATTAPATTPGLPGQ